MPFRNRQLQGGNRFELLGWVKNGRELIALKHGGLSYLEEE